MLLVNANADPPDAAADNPVTEQGPNTKQGMPLSSKTAANDVLQLASKFVAGEKEATEQVVTQFTPRIERLVGRILGWQSEVDDIVQETFIAALRGRRKFNQQSQLETWLVRIAINKCRAYKRKQWLKEKWFVSNAKENASEPNIDDFTTNPESQAISKERANQVRTAIANLSTKYREVIVLYYLEEMPSAEIANVLSVKPNTVDARLSRARKMLKKHLMHVS